MSWVVAASAGPSSWLAAPGGAGPDRAGGRRRARAARRGGGDRLAAERMRRVGATRRLRLARGAAARSDGRRADGPGPGAAPRAAASPRPGPGIDAGRLSQVVANLIDNAAEHGAGPVDVRWTSTATRRPPGDPQRQPAEGAGRAGRRARRGARPRARHRGAGGEGARRQPAHRARRGADRRHARPARARSAAAPARHEGPPAARGWCCCCSRWPAADWPPTQVRERERRVEARVGPLVGVVVAARDIAPGDRLGGARSGRAAGARALTCRRTRSARPGRLVGTRAAVRRERRLLPDGGRCVQGAGPGGGGPLRPGQRALEIAVTGGAALAGAGPGSRVDVLVSTQRQEGAGRTFVALEAVEVLELRASGSTSLAGRGLGRRAVGHRARHAAGEPAPGRLPGGGRELRPRGAPADAPARRRAARPAASPSAEEEL